MAKKKAAKRTDPETGNHVPEGQLGDWTDIVHEEVEQAAMDFDEGQQEYNSAKANRDMLKQRLIDKMKEHKCRKVPIRGGAKFLEYDIKDKVAYKAGKKTEDEEDD